MSAGWWFAGAAIIAALLLVLAVLLHRRGQAPPPPASPWPGMNGLMPGDDVARQHLAHAWELGWIARPVADCGANPYGPSAARVLWLLDVLVDPDLDMRARFGNAFTAAVQSRDWASGRGEMETALAEVLAQLGFDPHQLPHVPGICEHEEAKL